MIVTKDQAIELAIKKAIKNKRRYNICTSVSEKDVWIVKAERNTNWWGLKSAGIVSLKGEVSWDNE
tara:strand:+ start:706 stop:903 length:198 start_codon:yes stop_codon:yes gene_type:complete